MNTTRRLALLALLGALQGCAFSACVGNVAAYNLDKAGL